MYCKCKILNNVLYKKFDGYVEYNIITSCLQHMPIVIQSIKLINLYMPSKVCKCCKSFHFKTTLVLLI